MHIYAFKQNLNIQKSLEYTQKDTKYAKYIKLSRYSINNMNLHSFKFL